MEGTPTIRELLDAPVTVPLWPTAAKALGLGRVVAFELANSDGLPVTVFKHGRQWRVPTAGLLKVLEIDRAGFAAPAA